MSWTDRQRAMLDAMGLKLWLPPRTGHAEQSDRAAAGDVAVAVAPSPSPSLGRASGPSSVAAVASVARPTSSPVPASASASVDEPPAVADGPTARRAAEVLPPVPRSTPAPAPAQTAVGLPSAVARAGLPRESIAALDWTGLREAVSGCQSCSLSGSRKQTVFGVGHERAHWMIVGEAPGEQEDLQGEPFVGPAGKLLDSMLRSIGLSRGEAPPERQVFIANTLKCRPPRNRNPDPAELAECEPFLQRQIALIQPRIILAMGRFAVQQLLQSQEPIGRLRGRVHRYQGVPLIVTYHPAYLLRNLPDKARAWEDLCLALRTLEDAGAGAASPAGLDSDPSGQGH